MHAVPNDDKRFRSPALDASGWTLGVDQRLGQFDRQTLVLWLSAEVASALDRQGGKLPSFSVEKPGTPAMGGFSTHLHETIHYWQTVGSSIGFIYSLADATATFSVLEDLCAGAHRVKPVFRTLPSGLSADDPLERARLTWNDIEHGCAMLDDPVDTTTKLQENLGSFVSLGHSLLCLCVNTAARLGEAFDPRCTGLLSPEPWLGAYEHLVAEQRSGFEHGGIVEVPIGLRELMEGQARISEIQHRDLTQQAVSWTEVKANHWLRGIYGRAFEMYLQLAELPEPQSPRDDIVTVFLLLCDIALNPAVGYADPIDPAREFVHDFHPGIRFMKLCRAVLQDRDLVRSVGVPSQTLYESLSHRLCAKFRWKTPTEVARTLLDRWDKSALGDELAQQQHARRYGSADVHRRFIIGEHRSFLETRAQIPHFFCWPAWSILVFDDDPDDAATIDQVLGWHRTPFTADGEHGVNTVEIDRLAVDQRPQFVSDYFATLALYDLTRQWVALPGVFDWTCFPWKQSLTHVDIDRLKERFRTTYGLSPDDIRLA